MDALRRNSLQHFDSWAGTFGEPVTSMQELLGREVDMESVANQIVTRFAEVFDYSESNDQTLYEPAEELSVR